MPLTPLHGFAFLFLYFKDRRRVDLLALVVSATFVDLEVLYYLLQGETLNHRVWHSFAMSFTIYPILITLGVFAAEHFLEGTLWSAYNALRLKPNQVRYSLSRIYACGLIGGVSHVFLDMFTHQNMPYVIYPLTYGNPFYIWQTSIIAELVVIVLAVYSCLQWWREQTSRQTFLHEVMSRSIHCSFKEKISEPSPSKKTRLFYPFESTYTITESFDPGCLRKVIGASMYQIH